MMWGLVPVVVVAMSALSGCIFTVSIEGPDASVDAGEGGVSGDRGGEDDRDAGRDAGSSDGASNDQDAGFDAGAPVVVLAARLPMPLHEPAVAFDGKAIWIFGGQVGGASFSRAVLRFDPATETLSTTSAQLPSARQASGVVTFGKFVYLFGGVGIGASLFDDILRFDPATQTFVTIRARLPSGRYNLGVIATATKIYLVGGVGPMGGEPLDEIIEFDPVTEGVRVVGRLAIARESPVVALSDGGDALIFSGRNGVGFPRAIERFDPATGVAQTGLLLSETSWQPAPMAIGGLTYLYGGQGVDGVIVFDPSSGRSHRVPGASVGTRLGRGSVGIADRGYVFGGLDGSGSILDSIVRFSP